MNNRNEWVEVDNAVSMVGAIRGRLNNRDSAREFAFVLNDLRPTVVVTGPEFTDVITGLVDEGAVPPMRVLGLGPGRGLRAAAELGRADGGRGPRSTDDPYLVFHTSGTTGHYKGAVYLHRNWLAVYRNILAEIMGDVDPDCALLHVGPLSHQSGILTSPGPLPRARAR